MRNLTHHIRDFVRREDATATMEFVITFPVIMILFIGAFETAMIMTRQVMLERTLDQAVRILRLANGLTVSAADIRTAICDNTSMLPDCANLLTIDLQRVDRLTYTVPGNQDLCIERADASATPQNQFTVGADNDLMLVRACMIVDRIFPFSGYGLNLTRDDSGGLHMMAGSVFVNEPDDT
ncbi:TadE/TadG family type IV pilus assembly protein [Roseibacterium sp. SDUM158017]|uniref:TadE/TadG family type IV pilus assembly protein n=1 Tax=Roseicyclus salinarum TaxID=3036773 RepID=UPI00241535A9|nr:TadE/TadG family type IV pilus assembly protein [Roseibacterium sp. SDUM158017]MDG4647414.1 TadE/TadG family type IV pilus assembly protein [Roseibacterium sp. SDUM158017]